MSVLPSKEETVKQFRENEALKKLLLNVKDEKHKRVILGIAEKFLTDCYDMMLETSKVIEKDPEVFNKVSEDLNSRVSIVDSNKQEKNNV